MKDSITQSINDWLLTLDLIKDNLDIEIEELTDGKKILALQRTGVINIKTYYGGLKKQNEYQYLLFLKDVSETNEDKVRNFDWLDDLAREINTKSNKNDLPKSDKVLFNRAVCINPITYEVNEDGYLTNYAVQLYFRINE